MEKYTDISQAKNDASLAIISEDISSFKELNRIYIRYKALPKRFKRYSDYYSNMFLGRSVADMYVLVKERLKDDIFEDIELPSEKYAVSEPDLYYKEDSFNSGDTNICFILGHSGSGKSIMARTLEGDDIDHIELDDLLLVKDHFSMFELKEYSDLFYSYFNGIGAKYYIGIKERDDLSKEEYEDKIFIEFVDYALDYAAKHKDKKFIIDGIWIYLYFDDPSCFKDYTVFIKGTSFLKSKIRATKRELQRDKETIKERKQMFGRETRNYFLDEDKIDRYRDYFASLPETVYRKEDSEAQKEEEYVVDQLKRINECFVNEDEEGIDEIMKKAEADTSLSKWNRLRIIGECKTASLDIRLRTNLNMRKDNS